MARLSRTDRLAEAQKASAGVAKRLAPGRTYSVAGWNLSRAEMLAIFQAHLDAARTVDRLRAELAGAVQRERAVASKAKALGRRLKTWVLATYGADVEAVADFGWAVPRATGARTIAGKAEGVKTRAARREARKRALASLKSRGRSP